MENSPDEKVKQEAWWQTLAIYLKPEALRMLFLGFSAGLPLVLVMGTLSRRLAEAGIDRSLITFLSWVGLLYAFKWVWAPFVDQVRIPVLTRLLGRRRSWLLLSQILIVLGLFGMATVDIGTGLLYLVMFAIAVAFASATQDIALDAFRIESSEKNNQAALAATYQTGYRLAMIWAGAGALWIAAFVQGDDSAMRAYAWLSSASMDGAFWKSVRLQSMGTFYDAQAWRVAYLVMAASVSVGVLTVLLAPEPKFSQEAMLKIQATALKNKNLPAKKRFVLWLRRVLVHPFVDFIQRYGKQAVVILALISIYRISDVVMGIISANFYNDMGYTKNEVAAVSKLFGVAMTLVGAFLGGFLVLRSGVFRILMLGAVLSAATNVLFAWLAVHGYDLRALIAVISMDNLSAGIASAAFIAYLSSLTNVNFSATQYAILSSVMLLLPKFIGGFSGKYVDFFGYPSFFIATALLGLPVLWLVKVASKVHEYPQAVEINDEKTTGDKQQVKS